MEKQRMAIEVLADGTIKCETSDMGSGPVHKAADDFLAYVARLMGGAVEIEKSKHGHGHHHEHSHDHEHDHHHQ
jgi:hypothetical protein